MYEDLKNELKKNFEVLENTFEKIGLQLVNFGLQNPPSGQRVLNVEDADFDVLVEVTLKNSEDLKKNVVIRVNLYNQDDELIFTNDGRINKDTFIGYDTIRITCWSANDMLKKAVKGRMFAVLL